ncbi:hypothetical protein LCGC14_2731090 [marine sediment metagenome]|uniref:Uncharacterized protein n=1 Tax=marine sediment metagenome TaxID=412755 RepID=A0A0F9BG87_9ZZZZ
MECETCAWWSKSEDFRNCEPPKYRAYAIGHCRRYPPTELLVDPYDENVRFHIETEHDNWCGEFTRTAESLFSEPLCEVIFERAAIRLATHGILTVGQLVKMSKADVRALKEGLGGCYWTDMKLEIKEKCGLTWNPFGGATRARTLSNTESEENKTGERKAEEAVKAALGL